MTTEALTQFQTDVLSGLQAQHKSLPSKYFYDEEGDRLFQQIMHMDSYYLTQKELEIFQHQKEEILRALNHGQPFRIIELGAGDGFKTKVLLKYFVEQQVDFTYTPVDISGNVLQILEDGLSSEIPDLNIDCYQGDYFDALGEIAESPEKDIVFFLGSNIGNFGVEKAGNFLQDLSANLKPDDLLLMGVDMKKDPSVILKAYNDDEGITRDFNFNLLKRINRELDADLDVTKFVHYPYYNPQTGECRSYLISTEEQKVTVAGEKVHFDAWEAIFMEISKKYDPAELTTIALETGFDPIHQFLDPYHWYSDNVWRKK